MDRRTFLKATTVAAGSGLALSSTPALARSDEDQVAAPAVTQAVTELTFATAWAADVPVLGDASARMMSRLGLALGDRFRLVQVEAPPGSADLTFGPLPVDQDPAFGFFAGLPGSLGLEASQLQAWLAAGGGQMLWDDLAAQHGWKPILAGHSGSRPGLWANRPIERAADLAGGSMIVSGLGVPMARALGAEPIDLPPSELPVALATGRVAAVEWGNPLAALVGGLPEAATHFYRDGVHRAGTAAALGLRLSVWSRLDSSARAALEGAAAREFSLSLAETLAHERIAEQAIASTSSLSIADIPASLATEIDTVTTALIDDIGASSPDAARIRDGYMAFRRLLSMPDPAPLSA